MGTVRVPKADRLRAAVLVAGGIGTLGVLPEQFGHPRAFTLG